jgi:divalent metal cation (Fe/Co/Zn/Cd) transporter
MTVHDAHHIAEEIEADIRKVVTDAVVLTHIESADDENSLHDIALDRQKE